MFDVYFDYFDKNDCLCKGIDKIVYQSTDNKYETVSGDDILTHFYPMDKPIYLYGKSSSYVVSPNNLKSIIITKC